MKRLLPVLLLILAASCTPPRRTDKILAEVWDKDQGIRRQMVELTKAVTTEGRADLIDSLLFMADEQERIDAENIAIVDSLLQNGLPRGLSEQSYKTIWIVIDHSSLERQIHHLPLIEQMSAEGLIASSDYATLCDRVAMKSNRPQRYGTQSVQFGTPDAMQLYLWPVERPEVVDSLRATIGLSPIADYLETLSLTTGLEAKYIPALTVEEINRLRSVK